jgi:hypothetical protein
LAHEVDAGLERHDLLQLLKDVAVWESMPIHELKLEIAKNTGPAICDRGLPGFCPHMFSRSFLMLSAFGCIWLVKNVEEH